jgi:hypothetical protein
MVRCVCKIANFQATGIEREMQQGFKLLAGFCLGILFLSVPTLSQVLSDIWAQSLNFMQNSYS